MSECVLLAVVIILILMECVWINGIYLDISENNVKVERRPLKTSVASANEPYSTVEEGSLHTCEDICHS